MARVKRPARSWFTTGRDLAREWPQIDFQMHTRWTDGRSSVREMIAAAAAAELSALAITEHVNARSDWYPDFVAEVKAERAAFPGLTTYFGAEIAAADYRGGLKADPRRLEAEILLGVVHRYPKRDGDGFWEFAQLSREDAIDLEISALLGLASNPHIDVLGHPGGTAFLKYGAFPVQWLEPVIAAACEHQVALELNWKYLWDLNGLLALLERWDPLVSLGSDAHHASEIRAVHPPPAFV